MKDTFKKIGLWVVHRAKEPTTWTGLAMLGTIIGGPAVGVVIGKVGTIAGLILGGGLVANKENH